MPLTHALMRESPATTIFRTLILAVLLATLGGGIAPAPVRTRAGYNVDQKVVYHNGESVSEASACFRHLLGNLRNHVEAVEKEHVDIRVVSLGDGVTLF